MKEIEMKNHNYLFIQSVLIMSLMMGSSYPAIAADHSHHTLSTSSNASASAGDDEEGTPSQNANSVIAPGFLLHLTCRDDPKINGDFRVSMEGEVSLPYSVVVNAGMMRLKNLQKHLEKTYQPYFKGSPRITVTIKQKRFWVKTLGLVKSPGTYLLKEKTTLDEALAMAGVRTEDLSYGYARIGSGTKWRWISMEDYLKGGKTHDLTAWQGGEQILFQLEKPENDLSSGKGAPIVDESPSGRKIQVLGEVRNPGAVSFQHHADGYYYLIQRGGPTRDSDLSEVELLRRDPLTNEHKQISIGNMKNITNVQESDVLLIHADKPTALERGLQNTGLVASILSAIVVTILVVKK